MPSRRKLKKEIKEKTNLLIEDAFIESINGDEKEGKKMDELIDEIIDKRHAMLNKISDYPRRENRAKVKSHFNAIRQDLDTHSLNYSKKIGRIG